MSEYETERSTEYWPGEWVDPDDIEPNEWNPNELSENEFERLRDSIADNGWTMPIVVHKTERYIIDGEHRWLVSEHLPDDPDLTPTDVPNHYVPVYGITVSESQAKLGTIQHNRARGSVNVSDLQAYLEDLDDRGVLDSVTGRIGVTEEQTRELLGDIVTDDPPEFEEPAVESDDGAETESEDASESPSETPLPELHESRTLALRDDPTEAVLSDAEFIAEALTPSEYATVCEALGNEMRAQSLLNLIRYAEANASVEEVSR